MPQFSPTKSLIEEQLKRAEHIPAKLPWRIFSFSFIIFIALISIYGGIEFGYKPYLNSRLKSLDQKIADLTQSIDEQQQNNLINFYSQLVNLQDVLNSHAATSKFFDLVEKNNNQDINFTALSLGTREKEVKLEGIALNYDALVKQLELFRVVPEVDRVFLESSQFEEANKDLKNISGVKFVIKLYLKPHFFKAT